MQPVIGEIVGNYRIKDLLSKGGMGAVYKAVHVHIGRKAAVKVLLPTFTERTESVQRFFAEARATASIGHPGIVEIFDFGRLDNGNAYLTMELLEGEPLNRRLSDPMPLDRALVLMEHITSALEAAHAKGIVHRDLKPANIILVPDPGVRFGERTKLLDFGIAKLTDDEFGKEFATRTGTIMGTPAYMAPEQCRGASGIDQRADLYALGCVLFHLVCARPPFLGFGAGEIIGMQQYVAPPRPRALNPNIPPDVEALVLHLLEKDPAARVQSAEDLLAELAALTPSANCRESDGWSLQERRASSQRPPSSGMRKLDRASERGAPMSESRQEPTISPPEIEVIGSPASGSAEQASVFDSKASTQVLTSDQPTTLNSAVHSARSVEVLRAPPRRRRRYAAGFLLAGGLGFGGGLAVIQGGGAQAPVQAASTLGADGPSTSAGLIIGATIPAPDPAPASGASGGSSGIHAAERERSDGAASAELSASPSPAPRPAPVTITSGPADASVYLGEQKLGQTPLSGYTLPEGSKDLVLVVKKQGYRDEKVHVQPGATPHLVLSRADKGSRKTGASTSESETPAPGSQRPQSPHGPNDTMNPFPE